MTQQTTDPITGDAPLEPFSEKLIPEDRELPPNLKEIVERAIELHRETRELESRAKENRARDSSPGSSRKASAAKSSSQERTTLP